MLSTLFGNLPGMAYRCAADREWTMAFVSAGCLQLTERDPSALIGNASVAYADLIHPDDRTLVWDEVSAALEHREPWSIEYRMVMPDERVKWVRERGVGVRDGGDRLLYLEGFTTDISEQRRVEATLRDSEESLQGLLANIPGVPYRAQTVPPWRDEYIGAGVEELSGYTAAQLAAGEPPWEEIMHPDDREPLRRETEDAIAAGRKGELEYRIIRGDGE
jgi:PAS domain-containing protein